MLRDSLDCLSGSRHNADPLGKGHKLRQGFDLTSPPSRYGDGPSRYALYSGSPKQFRLLGIAANDKLEDFPLARRQSPETCAHAVQFVLQIA